LSLRHAVLDCPNEPWPCVDCHDPYRESFFQVWLRGARVHPGWGWAVFFFLITGAAGLHAGGPMTWAAWIVGAIWPAIVIATCYSVGKANP
jgi:hypothetical protein